VFPIQADTTGRQRRQNEGKERVDTAIDLVMLIVSITLILVILLQTKGSSFSGAFGGDSSSIYRTRRGVEKTLFQFTIGLAVVFLIIAIITSIVSG